MLEVGCDSDSDPHFLGDLAIVCYGLGGVLRGVMVLFGAPIAQLLGTR